MPERGKGKHLLSSLSSGAIASTCRTGVVSITMRVRDRKPRSWAAGIVYSVGWVNFLSDPSQEPHMKTADLAEAIGVSEATIMAKSKVIREGLDACPR